MLELNPISGRSNRVIIEEKKLEEKTNLVLPDDQKNETYFGEILSTSEWTNDNNITFPSQLKKGDLVMFQRVGAYRFNFMGKNLVTMRESEIIGIVIEKK